MCRCETANHGNDWYRVLGYKAHTETLCVMAFVGVVLGVGIGGSAGYGTDPSELIDLAKQGIALAIFFGLTLPGILALTLTEQLQLSVTFRKVLRWAALPMVRVGLTAGFATSAIIAGLGFGGWLSAFFGGDDSGSLKLLAYGAMMSIVAYLILYLFADTLQVQTWSMTMMVIACLGLVGVALYFAVPLAFLGYVSIIAIILALSLLRLLLRRRAQ